jgi:hypothetical protein
MISKGLVDWDIVVLPVLEWDATALTPRPPLPILGEGELGSGVA